MRLQTAGGVRAANVAQVALRFMPVGAFDVVKRDQPCCAGTLVAHRNGTTAVGYCWVSFHLNSLLFALVARLAERFFNLMRVNHSTSSDYSYAVGGYFVGSMPGWLVVRLGEMD